MGFLNGVLVLIFLNATHGIGFQYFWSAWMVSHMWEVRLRGCTIQSSSVKAAWIDIAFKHDQTFVPFWLDWLAFWFELFWCFWLFNLTVFGTFRMLFWLDATRTRLQLVAFLWLAFGPTFEIPTTTELPWIRKSDSRSVYGPWTTWNALISGLKYCDQVDCVHTSWSEDHLHAILLNPSKAGSNIWSTNVLWLLNR